MHFFYYKILAIVDTQISNVSKKIEQILLFVIQIDKELAQNFFHNKFKCFKNVIGKIQLKTEHIYHKISSFALFFLQSVKKSFFV